MLQRKLLLGSYILMKCNIMNLCNCALLLLKHLMKLNMFSAVRIEIKHVHNLLAALYYRFTCLLHDCWLK
jgi:hypothetical protein